MAPVLDIQDLSTHIKLTSSVVQAVGNIDLHVDAGETLGIVGESGCGKSMTGLSIMGLLPPGGAIIGGSVKLNGRELVGLRTEELRRIRGNEIAMIFQDPLTSLDPTKTIGYQVSEPVRLHRGASKQEALDRAVEVLSLVGLPRPKERLGDYPHQLSGGLRQRVMIAMALACEPKLLIADEPTTALDVTIQAQILALLKDLKDRLGMAMLLITHDMGVIAGHADRVNVMYAGRVVETAEAGELFTEMHHPYTQALLASIPQLKQDASKALHAIPGLPPDLTHPPQGCRFAARCPRASDKCRAEEPPLAGKTFEHRFACWHPVDGPLVLATIGEAGPDAESTGLVGPAAESLAEAAAGDKIGYVTDAPLTDEETAAADSGAAEPGMLQPVVVPAGLEVTADGRLEVTTRAIELAAADGDGAAPLLDLRNLVKEYPVTSGAILKRRVSSVKAVSDVSFSVPAGTTFGLVGESGCGKTTTGRLLTRLLEPTDGTVTFEGRDISHLGVSEMRPLRRDIQMVFQDPYSSLNPRHTVGTIVGAPFRIQDVEPEGGVKKAVQDLLALVGLSPEHYNRYPHEFSGGQRQRIGIARTLALRPKLIVADEPVSALDVSIQAQVVNLLEDLQNELNLTYVMIAHDLSVVRHVSDRVAVMYLGKIVELGDRTDVYERPMHPYTVALLSAVPIPDPTRAVKRERILLTGDVPSPLNPPPACRFHTRCWKAQEICGVEEPPLVDMRSGHKVACHFPENVDS
jgi:oligopeptide/dipeptide ABC transporter ATP-binding protein